MPDAVIRRCVTDRDFAQCVELQRVTWGAGFTDLVGASILRLAQTLGGVTAGAFASERLLGFVFGLTGVQNGRPAHWSHMLAVDPDGQNQGLGLRLKHFQRAQVRPLGVDAIRWTFDPLVARNAHFNFTRLGARAVQYVRDMYGPDTGSALYSGLGTDRLIAVWPVGDAADGDGAGPAAPPRASGPIVNPTGADGRPAFAPADAPSVRVAIPDDIQQVKQLAPAEARAWRASTRDAFLWYLARGYGVTAFEAERGRGGTYHLTQGPAA